MFPVPIYRPPVMPRHVVRPPTVRPGPAVRPPLPAPVHRPQHHPQPAPPAGNSWLKEHIVEGLVDAMHRLAETIKETREGIQAR